MMGIGIGLLLILSLVLIILLISKYKIHPTISLIVVSYFFGFSCNLLFFIDSNNILIENLNKVIASGFGNIMTSIGLVIIFGTLIGKSLEKTGATQTIANALIQKCGTKRPALLMSVMGWVTSIPIFCDSGFIILSAIKKSLSKASKTPNIVMSVSLATGLYASHTFVPPTPGPIAAASNLGISTEHLIWVMLLGSIVSFFCAATGYLWANSKYVKSLNSNLIEVQEENSNIEIEDLPNQGLLQCLIPLILPIFLMALASIIKMAFPNEAWANFFIFLGNPIMALFIGFILAYFLLLKPLQKPELLDNVVKNGLSESASILLITGAGGAFGQVIKATPIAQIIQDFMGVEQSIPAYAGLLLLFLIAALLKTAQGSSTAALVITSSLAFPLLSILGLDQTVFNLPMGSILAVMAIGAGSMVISHVNDSYFWVVSQFSGMDLKTAYKAQSLATLFQGLVGISVVIILSFILI